MSYAHFYACNPVFINSDDLGGFALTDNYGARIIHLNTSNLRTATSWLKTAEAMTIIQEYYDQRDGHQGEIRSL